MTVKDIFKAKTHTKKNDEEELIADERPLATTDLCLWGVAVLEVFSSTSHEFIVLPLHGHTLFG